MARSPGGPCPGASLCRRNIRLDSFLKRNTERAVYERLRAYEPCVVTSDSINKTYMHVLMSDERVYLTEYPPRALIPAFSFSSVRAIQLINDLPDFLNGKDRLQCQHIKIVYVPEKPASNRHRFQRNDPLFPTIHPSHSSSPLTSEGFTSHSWPAYTPRPTRSASCPNGETLGLVPQPPARPHSSTSMYPLTSEQHTDSSHSEEAPRTIGLVLSRLLKRDKEAKVAELHLYALSPLSTLYLHLQSIWTSFNMKSTLMLDPLYRRRLCSLRCKSTGHGIKVLSWEQTAQLFFQLQTELLQAGVSAERLYVCLQELHTAANRNTALRRLFWRSGELSVSLVQTLEDSLGGDHSEVHITDRLLLRTLIVQTLAVMFRETEMDTDRRSLLSSNNGALVIRMLRALICDADTRTDPQLRTYLSEYLDAACSLLFELILLGNEKSRFSVTEAVLSVGWIFQVLQPHPHLLSFVGYQTQQLLEVLSGPHSPISPGKAVLLFQRCRLLLACLQYCSALSLHLRSHFRDDFKYSVNVLNLEAKLPPHYPISPVIRHQVEKIRALLLL